MEVIFIDFRSSMRRMYTFLFFSMKQLIHVDHPFVQDLAEQLRQSGIEMRHVPSTELTSAIVRAVNEHILTLVEGPIPSIELTNIADVIDCNEEQTAVHESPSDPE